MPIHFFCEDVRFKLPGAPGIKKRLLALVKKHRRKTGEVNYIFCSDEYLFELNKAYLNHNTYTDIITFEYSTDQEILSDIYISVDRVKDNARKFNVPFGTEMQRVIVHGMLHLLGYKDKKPSEIKRIRKAEEEWLRRRK
ncbi:MAG: rRNA maturation RNase YbeY [Bacteroidia bacterium]|nr:rRNA maturation RNase YbeY [Bacteroidia bacterium]